VTPPGSLTVDVEHGDAAGVQRALDVGGEAVQRGWGCEPTRMIG